MGSKTYNISDNYETLPYKDVGVLSFDTAHTDRYFPEVYASSPYGIKGEPVPYTIRNDDFITSMLYVIVLIAMIAIAQSRDFIVRQFKAITRETSRDFNVRHETASEVRFQFFLAFQTCVLLGLTAFLYVNYQITSTYSLVSHPATVLYVIGIFIVYYVLKTLLQAVVGWVYFDPQENAMWMKSQLFLVAMEGVPLLPIVLLLCYFSMTFRAAILLSILVVICVKILTLYRCYHVFFYKKRPHLQIILYFCTLEIAPMMVFYGLSAQLLDAINSYV
ncbi:MAG: DUF4271 domain-containing protein [Bacteroidaceae bacterium]|nr:DUF4271 domain-containing protein [Bacteroidaceae bacterium]